MHSELDINMRFERSDDIEAEVEETNHVNPNLPDSSDVLTIEGLRRAYNSCSHCGVCWYDDHVSLDCRECGGYAMERPCPLCQGQCGNVWRRDTKESHMSKRAEWHGSCSSTCQRTVEDANANFRSFSAKIAS